MIEIERNGVKKYVSDTGITFAEKKDCQECEKRWWFRYLHTIYKVTNVNKIKSWDSDYEYFSFEVTEINKRFLSLFFSLMTEFIMTKYGAIFQKDLSEVKNFKKEFIPSKILSTLKVDADIAPGIYILAINWMYDDFNSIVDIDAKVLSKYDVEEEISNKIEEYEKIFGEIFYGGVY